jgi:hypothetical protein
MVFASPNLEYGPFGIHISTKFASPFTPSILFIYLFQDGLMKLCGD